MSAAATQETMQFQTEVKQLLKLMIHSLYSNKEIFLRELISNASDAADKLRFEALTDNALYESDSELRIRVTIDKDARTITISDNGIGMNRHEVIENIGTIAKSGTQQFLDSLTGDQAQDTQLIGQFGVGFYSSFIVADKVTIVTRRADVGAEHGVLWESAGEGDYVIQTVEKESRGTDVTLHLRESEDEFLETFRLQNIIRKYSDHVPLPIEMLADKPPAPIAEKEDTEGSEVDAKESETAATDETPEFETVNRASALWARSKQDITDEEYNEFYKHVGHDWEDPLARAHNKVEGKYSYTSLLYIPGKAPFDLWDRDKKHGLKLYVKRVFIMDDADQLLPNYLRFVRGIVDSDDLPLNVSREILQKNKVIDSIRAACIKRILGLLESIAKKDKEKYQQFWDAFGRVIKEGPAEDFANKEKIAKLLRFSTTHTDSETQDISLSDYVERMKEGQDKIYYITADSFAAAKNSPHLEIFRKKGLEVVLLSERVDEWLTGNLTDFDGKSFQSVAKGDLDLGDLEDKEEKEANEKAQENNKDLVARIKSILTEDKVKEVRLTNRLTTSPACLVVEDHEMSTHLERLLKDVGQNVPNVKPILEINPDHPLVLKFKDEADETRFADWANILFDQALLSEGGQLEDPATFIKRLNELLLVLASD
ncbi:Chaperone protein HtpG [hydrothermal vent metagenome]|uniref:Chaperone protein HtpG n=1 Tax=hydrothermal vent metagenome TaxID=652676 RepID=A0A3B1A697_9ZZZZ